VAPKHGRRGLRRLDEPRLGATLSGTSSSL
jgi:hypothetical protein